MKKPLFIHIPKTGGTSYRRSLQSAGIKVFPLIGDTHHGHYKDLLKENPEFTNDDYQPFTIIRNPWDRMVSIFHFYKYGGAQGCGYDHCQIETDVFSEFPDEFLNKPEDWEWAYVTQKEWSLDTSGKDNVFFGRFEHLHDDFQKLLSSLGVPFQVSLQHHRKSKRATDYQSYYTQRAKDIVSEIFKENILEWDYKYE